METCYNSYYDEDYYKNGITTGKSCYENYRWMPEATLPMAFAMMNHLGIKRGDRVLEIGCALGYLVRAFRILEIEAYGIDNSEYAIDNADKEVRKYCTLYPTTYPSEINTNCDFCIAKDVFEHINKEDLVNMLNVICAKKLFVIVPLGENGSYYAEANNFDSSHVICENEHWWSAMFRKNGWFVEDCAFSVDGIKDAYSNIFKAHCFFTLQRS